MTTFLKTKAEIITWLESMNVKDYTLRPNAEHDFVVDVQGSVNLSRKKLTSIPVKFGVVEEEFFCTVNLLTSLDFSPESVGGGFHCGFNKITSLQGAPQSVESFNCLHNQLTSLMGAPQQIINGNFNCAYNQLGNLAGSPQIIKKDFNCDHNQLVSLEGCPQSVGGDFCCNSNQLATLLFCPKKVGGLFCIYENPDLHETQYVTDFSEIFEIHEAQLIQKDKKELDRAILDCVSSSKTYKL